MPLVVTLPLLLLLSLITLAERFLLAAGKGRVGPVVHRRWALLQPLLDRLKLLSKERLTPLAADS